MPKVVKMSQFVRPNALPQNRNLEPILSPRISTFRVSSILQDPSPTPAEFETSSLEKRTPFFGLLASALSLSQVKKERRPYRTTGSRFALEFVALPGHFERCRNLFQLSCHFLPRPLSLKGQAFRLTFFAKEAENLTNSRSRTFRRLQ